MDDKFQVVSNTVSETKRIDEIVFLFTRYIPYVAHRKLITHEFIRFQTRSLLVS